MSSAFNYATANSEWDSPSARDTVASPVAAIPMNYPEAKTRVGGAWAPIPNLESEETATAVSVFRSLASTVPTVRISTGRIPARLRAEWSGYVVGLDSLYFSAALKGVFGEGIQGEEEDAEIPISDVSQSDKELLQVGNFFRLCVFYEIQENGQPRRYTQVVFRRLPAYRAVDLALAAERAAEPHRALRVE